MTGKLTDTPTFLRVSGERRDGGGEVQKTIRVPMVDTDDPGVCCPYMLFKSLQVRQVAAGGSVDGSTHSAQENSVKKSSNKCASLTDKGRSSREGLL